MLFQIILLPANNYWEWVRASKDYVLKYGANLTSEPEMAAGYMAPRQVITFPNLPGAYPGQGDIVRWFESRCPGVQLDPIAAGSPSDFKGVLEDRIAADDRFGTKDKQFYLVWPTNYDVITQPFRANPQIYARWGLPGHEGVDVRALTNTNIYCCADGEVYEVHRGADDHPYGIHIRVRHRDGYKTIYGHLAQALVGIGDKVEAGQVIGKADSTGASSASHLHMTLKKEGATARGETDYPKDIIDPTPYLVRPLRASKKSVPDRAWGVGKCLVGAHGRVSGRLLEADLDIIRTARLEALKINLQETGETLDRLRAWNPGMFFVARLSGDFSGRPIGAEEFVSLVGADAVELHGAGVRDFEIHANPNLQTDGWRRSWKDGAEFGLWFDEVVGRLRAELSDVRFGFPGLSIGPSLSGWRGDMWDFLEGAEYAAASADWIGVNCHWTDSKGMRSLGEGMLVEEYRARFPESLLFVTEFGNPGGNVGPEEKGHQYVDFYRMLRDVEGVGAAFCYALSAREGHDSIVWRPENQAGSRIAEIVGSRGF